MTRYILLSLLALLLFPPLGLAMLLGGLSFILLRYAGRDGGIAERRRSDAYIREGK